jgi:hypothetical protein
MVEAYNFLASWQLFPEKCTYEQGVAPKSGNYKIESVHNQRKLLLGCSWVSIENQAFFTQYEIVPDGEEHPFDNKELADAYIAGFTNSSTLHIRFLENDALKLEVVKEIMPNGYMRITQKGIHPDKGAFTNVEVYHKHLSVLPYASSVGSVAIRPTKEGVIKHKALTAMEEQTNMQLDQIRQQIELLARQAQELRKRKELSLMIYEATISFKPQIGQVYHLYERNDSSHLLSLVAPGEWGGSGPFKSFVSSVRLLADHTWVEV